MSTTNTATPLPAPDASANNATASTVPNLTVVPPPAPDSPSAYGLTRAQLTEVSLARTLTEAAARADYAPAFAGRGVDAAFLDGLRQDIAALLQQGQAARHSDSARQGATTSEAAAQETLVNSLRTLQGHARAQHLPDKPHALGDYYVGERLDENRPVLEAVSQAIIDKANQDRPAGVDTGIIERVAAEREQFLASAAAQNSELGKGKLARAQRDRLVKSLKARRKKIQYVADTLWPAHQPENAQARSDFQLPATRPYSY